MLVSPSQAVSLWGTVGWRQGCHMAEHVCPLPKVPASRWAPYSIHCYYFLSCLYLLWGQLAFQVTIKKHCVCVCVCVYACTCVWDCAHTPVRKPTIAHMEKFTKIYQDIETIKLLNFIKTLKDTFLISCDFLVVLILFAWVPQTFSSHFQIM